MINLDTIKRRAREEKIKPKEQRRPITIQQTPMFPGATELRRPTAVEQAAMFPEAYIKPAPPDPIQELRRRVDTIGRAIQRAERVRRDVGRGIVDFGVAVLRDFPRSVAQLELKAEGMEKFVPGTGRMPRTEKFLFGKEPIYTPEETGRQFLRAVGVGEERAEGLGGVAGYPLAVLGVIPIIGTKKKLPKKLAKEGTKVGKKRLLKQSIKGIDEKSLDDLAEQLMPIKDPKVIQQRLDDFIKKQRTIEKVKPAIPIKKTPVKPAEILPVKPLTVIREKKAVPGLKFRERGFIHRVKETSPELKQMVKGQYVPRSTDRLAIKARNLIRDDIMMAERIAREGTDDKAVAVASELINHYNNLGALARNEADKLRFYGQAADIANEIAPKLTAQGRAIQAATIYGRLTPEGILRFSARQIQQYNEKIEKVPPLIRKIQGLPDELSPITKEKAKELVERARVIQAMPDGEVKAMAFHAFQDDIAKLVPTPTMKKVINIWKAGLLTGIRTTGLNLGANLFHGISEVVKDIPAAVVDSVAELFTGKREVVAPGMAEIKAGARGIKEGFNKGWRYLRTGFDERDIAIKFDHKRVNFGNSPVAKALQKYEQSIFRFIGAQDQPFYYGAKARSLQNQAMAQAKNKKLKGIKAQRFVDDLVANPTDDMLKNAVSDAETAVFQNKTALGAAAQAVQRIGGGAGEIVVPFARTPSAVAMQILNYSPVGIARAMGEAILAGRNFPQIQRQFSLAMGRGITGTAVLGLGAYLFGKGRVSLGFPADERERKQWELEGKQPNSILIGGKWRRAHVLGPAGLMLIWGGHIRKFYDETGSQTEAANLSEAFLRSLGGMGQTFTEQTFVQGVGSALELLTDPERNWQRAVRTLAGPFGPSAIPTIVANVAQATDPYQRITGPGLEGMFIEGAMARIPGLREQLQPRIDVTGEIVPRAGTPLEAMIDPTRPIEARTSPIIAELRRLSDAGYRATPTDFGGRHGFRSLTPEQNTILEQNAGQRLFRALEELFASEEYMAMTDGEREEIIQRFTRIARRNARAELLKEILYGPEGPQGAELAIKIERLKEDKVLTQEVRKRLLELLEQ